MAIKKQPGDARQREERIEAVLGLPRGSLAILKEGDSELYNKLMAAQLAKIDMLARKLLGKMLARDPRDQVISAPSIGSGETFGHTRILAPTQVIPAPTIPTAEAFGDIGSAYRELTKSATQAKKIKRQQREDTAARLYKEIKARSPSTSDNAVRAEISRHMGKDLRSIHSYIAAARRRRLLD